MAAPLTGDDFRARLHAALIEAQMTHIADAVEHCGVEESANEIVFTAPKMYQMFLKQPDLDATVRRLAGRIVKITIKVGEAGAAPAMNARVTSGATAAAAPPEDEATTRAMENPEVQRFRETFPDSQVRTVRNLKDR